MPLRFGRRLIKVERVDPLLEYLKGGPFRNKSNWSFVKAYSVVVEHGSEEPPAQKLFDFFVEVVTSFCEVGVASLGDLAGLELLAAVARYWEKFTILALWMHRVFQYLDRFFLAAGTGRQSLLSIAVQIHAERAYALHEEPIVKAVLDEINKERDGFPVDVEMLRKVVELLLTTKSRQVKVDVRGDGSKMAVWISDKSGCYKTYFEAKLLVATKDYCQRWAAGLMSRSSCPEAVHEIERRLGQEDARLHHYLDPSSGSALGEVWHQELVSAVAQRLCEMETGVAHMLENTMKVELKSMFNLFKKEPKLFRHMTVAMGPYVGRRAGKIMDDAANAEEPERFVLEMLKLKRDTDELVATCFENETGFQRARNRALENVLNKDARCAKYLAWHCDSEIKKGLKSKSDGEVTIAAESMVGLLTHLKDKDVFLDYYRRCLAKRLLQGTSVSNDAEEIFLSKITLEVGLHAVHKLKNMFTDMHLSGEEHKEYAKQPHGGRPGGIEHQTQVFRMNAWPGGNGDAAEELGVVRGSNVVVCSELRGCTVAFETFYNLKHTGRKLSWQFGSGACDVASSCYQAKHTFVVSTYQCVILMLFNKHTQLTIRQVLDLTKIPEIEAKRHIQSMTVARQKLLTVGGDDTKLESNTPISVNGDFSSDKLRVMVNLIKDKQKPQAAEQEPEETAADRKHIVDAAIVRIMKARQTLDHITLVNEVMRLCILFKPPPSQIKMQIDTLIEREFLKRDPAKENSYVYIP